MTTTVYYADSFPPTAWDFIIGNQPTWEVVLTNGGTPATELIRYSLYADTDTFANWLTWSKDNRVITNENDLNYDGTYVLSLIGTWPQFDGSFDDMMCIADSSTSTGKGAICIQTDQANSATKTYNFTNSQWAAFLAAYVAQTVTDGAAETDYAALAEFTAATEMALSTSVFEGFQKFYCEDYSSGNQLSCRAWSRTTTVAAVTSSGVTSGPYGEADGFPRFADKESVFFFWIDRSSTDNTTKFYPNNGDMTSSLNLRALTFTNASYLSVAFVAGFASLCSQLM